MRGSRSWHAVPDASAHRQSCQGFALSGDLCFVGWNCIRSAGPFWSHPRSGRKIHVQYLLLPGLCSEDLCLLPFCNSSRVIGSASLVCVRRYSSENPLPRLFYHGLLCCHSRIRRRVWGGNIVSHLSVFREGAPFRLTLAGDLAFCPFPNRMYQLKYRRTFVAKDLISSASL
jgi:hypothetical protein